MSNEVKINGGNLEEQTKEVNFICPICQNKKRISVPKQIINQSKQLTTVSLPSGLICEHSFQAFIDKNFKVRGYQKVDYELSKMEYMEGVQQDLTDGVELDSDIDATQMTPFIQESIKLLRNCVDDKDVTGSAIFTVEGRVLYSSLALSTLSNTIREFETRNKSGLVQVKRLFLLLENKQKIFSEYIELEGQKLIIVLVFSDLIKLGMGNLLLVNLIKDIRNINA